MHDKSIPRVRDADRTISLLKQATIEQLISNGFAGLSIIPILKKAGVSRGALFHHFESKDKLIAAAFDDILKEFASRMHEISHRLRNGNINQEEFVSQIGDAFASDLFIASMEMSLGIRAEHSLSEAVNDAIANWRMELLAFWTNTFDIPGLTPAEQTTHWAIASNALRGHGFTTSFGLEASAIEHMQSGFYKIFLKGVTVKPPSINEVLPFRTPSKTT
ncbi:MAG: TetR/AcrR family transcriptional regulator [Granulosicoccus sp.]